MAAVCDQGSRRPSVARERLELLELTGAFLRNPFLWGGGSFLLTVGAILLTVELLCLQSQSGAY